jgi:hypothetical protein
MGLAPEDVAVRAPDSVAPGGEVAGKSFALAAGALEGNAGMEFGQLAALALLLPVLSLLRRRVLLGRVGVILRGNGYGLAQLGHPLAIWRTISRSNQRQLSPINDP